MDTLYYDLLYNKISERRAIKKLKNQETIISISKQNESADVLDLFNLPLSTKSIIEKYYQTFIKPSISYKYLIMTMLLLNSGLMNGMLYSIRLLYNKGEKVSERITSYFSDNCIYRSGN